MDGKEVIGPGVWVKLEGQMWNTLLKLGYAFTESQSRKIN